VGFLCFLTLVVTLGVSMLDTFVNNELGSKSDQRHGDSDS